MTDVRLPFWIVNERSAQIQPINSPCDDPKAIHAFTSGKKVTDYLMERVAGTWKISLVNDRSGLTIAVADARHNGSTTICFDPDADGFGGTPVDLTTLFALRESIERSA